MPQQLSPFVEQRIVAFALGHPGYGPRRIASELRQERWGGIVVSHNGIWRCLRRHGLNTRAKRLSLVAGYAAPCQPPRQPEPERHVEAQRPGELVGIDCFFVGRLSGTKGAVWQLTAIDVASSFAWAELVRFPRGNPTGAQTSKLARWVCAELAQAGWRLERILSDNGGEFRSTDFRSTLAQLGARHTLIRAGRPQTNGAVEALHRPILEECRRLAFARYLHVRFTGLKRDLAQYIDDYNFRRVTTAASPAAASPPTSSTVPTR
jgi:transposase InsO family protein